MEEVWDTTNHKGVVEATMNTRCSLEYNEHKGVP